MVGPKPRITDTVFARPAPKRAPYSNKNEVTFEYLQRYDRAQAKNQTAQPSGKIVQNSQMESDSVTRTRLVALILKAAALAAFLATLLSALTIELLTATATRGGDSAPRVGDVAKATALLCAITVVPSGSFGFLAGVAGGAVLYMRRKRIRSVRRFLTESAAVGLVLGCLFPVFDAAVNALSVRSYRSWLNPFELIYCVPVAIASALLCALVLRRHMVS